jgi:hypothetical protein
MKRDLPVAIAKRGGSFGELLKKECGRMEQSLRKAFAAAGGEGLVEVATKEECAARVGELIAAGQRVIILDDGTLVGADDASRIAGKAGEDYCVVSAEDIAPQDGMSSRHGSEVDGAGFAPDECGRASFAYGNVNAMALMGVGILTKDTVLFSKAYRAFAGCEAPAGLIDNVMKRLAWLVRVLPRIVRISADIRAAEELHRLIDSSA